MDEHLPSALVGQRRAVLASGNQTAGHESALSLSQQRITLIANRGLRMIAGGREETAELLNNRRTTVF